MMQISAYGRLGKDPKAIQTQSGKAMTTASLAVSLDLRADGETLDGTQWLNLLAFGKAAEQLERHKGGELLNVFGRCQLSRYETRDGETRESLAVIVDALLSARSTRPGGNRKRNDNQGNDQQDSPPDYPPADPEPYRQRAGQSGQGNDPGFVDDEIPF